MFNKSDIRFEEMAVDPVRRRAAIANLSIRRTVMFWVVMLLLVTAIGASWSGSGSGTTLTVALFFSIYVGFESELRLLRVIDRLHKNSDEKPVA